MSVALPMYIACIFRWDLSPSVKAGPVDVLEKQVKQTVITQLTQLHLLQVIGRLTKYLILYGESVNCKLIVKVALKILVS